MYVRKFRLPAIMFATIVLPASFSCALSFQLGETKEQLKLDYDVSVKDHGTGRVTVVLTIADPGRLNPLNSVDFVIPDMEKRKDGGRYMDLSVALATRDESGKQVARVHVLKVWAERAEIWFTTSTLDGKNEPLTGYYHVIPIADYMKKEERKAK